MSEMSKAWNSYQKEAREYRIKEFGFDPLEAPSMRLEMLPVPPDDPESTPLESEVDKPVEVLTQPEDD